MNRTTTLIILLIVILTPDIASAATYEVVSGKLPSQLHEGDQINFTLQIKTDTNNEKNITIETNLISSDNNPLYDFGDLNAALSENRYNQKITLDTSSISSTFQVKVSGKVPSGETRIKVDDSALVISKFINTKLKFYEIHTDQKLVGIESFELIINKKEKFENTLESIRRPELDTLKTDTRNLFDTGLTNEAQDIADDMNNIKFPGSLTLFNLIKINNDTILNSIVIISVIIVFTIGYLFGSRPIDEDENSN